MDDPLSRILGMHTWAWEWQAMVRLALAAVLGACIGIEREHRGRAAGFRTLLLVAMGSALAMVVSINFGNVYSKAPFASEAIRVDPARVAYGVMVGIGFLGGGVIMRHGEGVRGLTTAAALWCTAAIGLACGFGMFTIALAADAMVLATLLGLFHLERVVPTRSIRFLSVTLPISGEDTARKFADWVKARGVPVIDLQCERDLKAGTETLTFEISLPGHVPASSLLDIVEKAPQASRISIR
jgi:putative Mg2+ transporter-C (MgtC) family protein